LSFLLFCMHGFPYSLISRVCVSRSYTVVEHGYISSLSCRILNYLLYLSGLATGILVPWSAVPFSVTVHIHSTSVIWLIRLVQVNNRD
jgi:hypothetical protein